MLKLLKDDTEGRKLAVKKKQPRESSVIETVLLQHIHQRPKPPDQSPDKSSDKSPDKSPRQPHSQTHPSAHNNQSPHLSAHNSYHPHHVRSHHVDYTSTAVCASYHGRIQTIRMAMVQVAALTATTTRPASI